MIATRLVALLAAIILASIVIRDALRAFAPFVPLLIVLGVAVAAGVAVSTYRNRW